MDRRLLKMMVSWQPKGVEDGSLKFLVSIGSVTQLEFLLGLQFPHLQNGGDCSMTYAMSK